MIAVSSVATVEPPQNFEDQSLHGGPHGETPAQEHVNNKSAGTAGLLFNRQGT